MGAAVSSASGVSDISSSALDSSWIRTCATSGARARAPSPPRPRARISHRRVFWAWAAQQFSTDCAPRRARRRRGPRTMRYGGRLRQHVCSPSSGTHPVVFNHAAEPLERTARRPLSPRTFLYRADRGTSRLRTFFSENPNCRSACVDWATLVVALTQHVLLSLPLSSSQRGTPAEACRHARASRASHGVRLRRRRRADGVADLAQPARPGAAGRVLP